STPAARALGLARALAAGALVKRGDALEALAGVRHVVFDKTGTLTRGEPAVVALFGAPETLALAAALEAGSEHPLGRAIVAHAAMPAEPPADFIAEPGGGVRGTIAGTPVRVGHGEWLAAAGFAVPAYDAPPGATLVYVAHGERVVGAIALADPLRPEAADVLAQLRSLGLGVTLLTGDAAEAANAVAWQLGISDVRSRATPAGKLDALRDLRARHGAVLMVGDGLNDAPALAAADVGVAVARGGADLAVVTADAVLAGDLTALPGLVVLARRTVAVIHTNFRLSALYNAIAIPLAVAGLVGPLVAAVLMPLSSLAVMASALRLAKETP
ncbi:MAG: ATPase, partial [Cyanobacteria bacterium RYN_339]|nr:ATPase [Cyanobacteria bacterium RYN_339]